ncbi:MAG: hypothetical protein IJ324_09940 [Lachnospiraceae bacterium]|nr:hypothetical protein [Lachnospiraceae bacterium]
MGYIDVHSHILPGLDDGSRSIEQSVEMLRIAWEEGITKIIATPHNMPGKGCPTIEVLEERLIQLRTVAENAGIDIELYLGTEYYYREEVSEILEREDAVTMAGSEYVLLEFNPLEERSYILNAVRDVYSLGYNPVIAHVERYEQLMKKKEDIAALKNMGALIQVNASSVIGDNGYRCKRDVKKLLKEHLVDFVATDAHSAGHRAPRMEKCAAYLYKRYGQEYAEALLFKNAEKYFF